MGFSIGLVSAMQSILHLNKPNPNGTTGIAQNKIVEIIDFLSEHERNAIVMYLESKDLGWSHVASYEYRNGKQPKLDDDLLRFGLPKDFFQDLVIKVKTSIGNFFSNELSLNTIHAQKWGPGGVGHPHSDNTDEDGNPSFYEINKISAIIYLDDQYSGGELYFPEHDLQIKPKSGSMLVFPGGKENVHGVNELVSGKRHTIISFWDFSDSKYSKEREMWRNEEMKAMSDKWLEEWNSGWYSKWRMWNFL